jgi:C4-dicarboxylate transporter, DctQ subunit
VSALTHLLGRALDRLVTALAVVAALIVVAMVVAVAYEVVMRYAFNQPTRWVIEFSEYALVYVAYLAGAWVLKEEGHVKVEFVVEMLPAGFQRFLHVLTSLVGAAVCGTIAWVGTQFAFELFQSGEVLFRSIQMPKWAILAVVPFGMLLLAIQFVRRAFRDAPTGPGPAL